MPCSVQSISRIVNGGVAYIISLFLQRAINFSSENIPNGMGFGGQPHHFGLFLSANFDQGHSFTCSTFTSPPLSKIDFYNTEISV